LCIEHISGAREALSDFELLCAEGRALNDKPLIDRDAIYRLKMRVLEKIWSQVREKISFIDFERRRGRSLQLFASFCVLAEQFGANWRAWPQQYRSPDSPAVLALIVEFGDRIRFHKWLQYLLDGQLKAASSTGNIMQDLPVGVAPDG